MLLQLAHPHLVLVPLLETSGEVRSGTRLIELLRLAEDEKEVDNRIKRQGALLIEDPLPIQKAGRPCASALL